MALINWKVPDTDGHHHKLVPRPEKLEEAGQSAADPTRKQSSAKGKLDADVV